MKKWRAARRGRRGIAGIVAIVIVFAILFTVGTSYFIFENSVNASYVSSLLAATNKAQGTHTESLLITTLLEGNGDVGFFANDTSSMTVNMTAVLVISSTGALLKCDGVGFPAGAGCSNSTPALWVIIDASGGSPKIDTGYVYSPGTTVTLKALTARGNTYSQTYPEPASASGSTQSVTVNLDDLKWVQLIPQASSLVHKAYTSNCNAQNCALAYGASVTAGNILVDGLSWLNQAPPSTPTDTLGDAFTLGANVSVAVPASPALVQDKYTSNCNAASCGLAYTSPITGGHALVFAVGWSGQNAPSAPTDTRGDSFTLGASQSVSTNAGNPSVVQQRYVTNCSSATCALAYSSAVTGGNTLVEGLGWYSNVQYQYVPVIITNNQGSATPATFQQSVTWNPSAYSAVEASDLGNIRFCSDSACNVLLNAWLESCTAPATCSTSSTSATAWVKLTSAIAGSGGTLTIYMVFQSTGTDFDSNHWGEAPNISSTYGHFDNGANVFNFYDNFAGNTLSVKWTVVKTAGGAVTVNNGATFTTSASNDYVFVTSVSQAFPQVAESYMVSANSGADPMMGVATTQTANGHASLYAGYSLEWISSGGTLEYYNLAGSYVQMSSQAQATFPAGIWAVTWSATGSEYFQDGAGNSYAGADNHVTIANYGVFVGVSNYCACNNLVNRWDRTRAYPPSNVMPSVSFGSLTGNTVPTMSDTLGDSFTLGVSKSILGSTATPSQVQHRYISNCNAANCGLAYSSPVTAGDTLVYGLGWFGQNPPSTPTDTRGDVFVLGGSNSVSTGSSGTLAIDGSTTAGSGGAATNSQTTGTLTTANANDVIVVVASLSDGSGGSTTSNTVSAVTAAGLSFVKRAAVANFVSPNYFGDVEEWYAIASSTFSNTITVTTTGSFRFTVAAFGVSGANTLSPFDPNASANPTASGTSSTASVTQSTSNANDMLITGLAIVNNPGTVSTFPTGFTNIANVATGGVNSQAIGVSDYDVVAATKSNLAVSYGLSTSSSWAMLGDAIKAGGTNYYSYVWYATAASSGADTITAAFGGTVTGSVSIYELGGVTPLITSAGSSSIAQGSSSVASMTPSSNSIVIGNTETTSSTITAGAGYTLAGTCSSVYGCGEYETGVGSATTVPMTISPSAAWVETAMAFAPATPTYYSYIWYATAASSGGDTITATFTSSVSGSASIYEVSGATTSGTLSSTGSSSAGSTAANVGSFAPNSNSLVVGNVETGSGATKYTAGAGYTTVASGSGGCDASDASQGCDEYETGIGSATTTPFTLSASTSWVDVALSFAPATPITYYSYIWYATAASSGADTIIAAFSSSVAGSVSIYELSGVTPAGLLTSTGSSSASQASTSVSSITPGAGSLVVGNAETSSTVYTAGGGYTLSGGCSSVTGCGEYQTGVGSATTVPISISPSAPWAEAAVAFAPLVNTYYSYIWYATAGTSGADTITAHFGAIATASVSIYEITGFTTSGAQSSTGSSLAGSTTAAVASFTPATDSFIIGNAESGSATTTYTATAGFALAGSCNSVYGCSEYVAGGGGSASIIPLTLSASAPWVEAAMSFSTPFNPQSGIQVNGYPTMGVPSGASLVWEVTFTNEDSQHRSITIWPQTEEAIGSAEFDGFDTDYTQAHYYIIDSLNAGSTTVNAYTTKTGQFATLAYNVPTTLYFAATAALGSTTQTFGTNVLTPFEAYFALTGTFSDGSLYGETIPFPYGIITQANAFTTPTAGATGNTVTVSCTSPCNFSANTKAMAGWINSAGQLTQLATFTTTAGGNVPAGVTFAVPTATAGYYTIEVTDYTNSVFMTFQHT